MVFLLSAKPIGREGGRFFMKKISTAFLIIVFVIAQSLPILALSNESHGYGYKKSEGESPPD